MAYKVFVDAGHGGHDPGAVDGKGNDPYYTEEEDINLAVAKLLDAALRRNGILTKMSRTSDVYHTISKRADMADAFGAHRVISIHFNAGPSSAKGAEVLYVSSGGSRFAANVYKYITVVSPWGDRGIKKRTNLGMLNQPRAIAILVEGDFVTNNEAEKLMRTSGYQSALAEAICRGTCRDLGVTYRAPGASTSKPTPKPAEAKDYMWFTSVVQSSKYKAALDLYATAQSDKMAVRAGMYDRAILDVHTDSKDFAEWKAKIKSYYPKSEVHVVKEGDIILMSSRNNPVDNSIRMLNGRYI